MRYTRERRKLKISRSLLWMSCFLLFWVGHVYSGDIRLKDAAGKSLLMKHTARRIVVVGFAPYIPLHMLYMFPETRQVLVGYEQKVKAEEIFLPLIDPGYKNKTVLNDKPGPEQVAALKPDLVITKSNVPGYLDRTLAVLGIPVLHLGVETPEQFIEDIQNIGKVLGNEKRSAEISAFYRDRLDRIQRGLSDISPEKKPRALVLEYSNRGGTTTVRVPARSWMQTIQVRVAGGEPVWLDQLQALDGYQLVGFEQIAQWNPDKIFMIVWFRLNGQEILDALKADKKWQLLKAVSDNQLYLFPQDIYGWDTPDCRWILGLLWMAKTMYPDRFKKMDIEQEIFLFFHRMFGMDKENIEREIMTRVKLHAIE